MENKLDEVVVNLSGDLIMLDWKGNEKLISLKDLVDKFKLDMKQLKDSGNTDVEVIEYMDKSFSDKLEELAQYAKEVNIDRKRTLQ